MVRKRLRGVTITPATPRVSVLRKLLKELGLKVMCVRMEAYQPNRRRLRVYALAPFQKRSRWLEGVDIPGIEWH